MKIFIAFFVFCEVLGFLCFLEGYSCCHSLYEKFVDRTVDYWKAYSSKLLKKIDNLKSRRDKSGRFIRKTKK